MTLTSSSRSIPIHQPRKSISYASFSAVWNRISILSKTTPLKFNACAELAASREESNSAGIHSQLFHLSIKVAAVKAHFSRGIGHVSSRFFYLLFDEFELELVGCLSQRSA